MRISLAIDAGGTSSRAAVLDPSGLCLGTGRALGGNPTSSGIESAVEQISAAAAEALAAAGVRADAGSVVAITQAGQVTTAYREQLLARFAPIGFDELVIEPDLLGMFGSGTPGLRGSVLIAGTGSVAGRVEDGALVREIGGAGWLLGDDGSGFWIARRVVRAVAADLDGLGPRTALTPLLTEALGISLDEAPSEHRSNALGSLIDHVYGDRPIALARFAPLAFAATGDDVAERILAEAVEKLAELLSAVHRPGPDVPVVVGGSVLVDGLLQHSGLARERLTAASGGARLVPVADGLVGAGTLALRRAGSVVDDDVFHRIDDGVAPVRARRA
ncbi:N-acetylglucosamine kinase [Plantibacter sp. YIM 135249]|uniref:N-acetylglucosamine kinase n=1 Tax=Plantibacter sp. YIM 135249 TaxID=3423918 RepID=UPI003D32570C